MVRHTAAHYLLEALCETGIDYVFGNLGTDHVPIIEELARWQSRGRAAPRLMICPHEVVAVHMAGGYAMATGRGQAVLAHVDVGTANAAMGLHNFARTRVPLMLIAGRAPFTSRGELPGSRDTLVNFIQDPFDLAGLVRPFVKWSYDLPSGVVVKEVMRRAHSAMHSDPRGPVFLTIAREILAADHDEGTVPSYAADAYGPLGLSGADDAAIEAIAERLLAARDPVLITQYAGRNPDAPAVLERLGTLAGIRVYEANPTYLNISRRAACYAGSLYGKGAPTTDFGLLVDVDVPWIPSAGVESPDSHWAQIDVDAAKRDLPLWPFPAHSRLQADSVKVLRRLCAIVENRTGGRGRIPARPLASPPLPEANPGRVGAMSAAFVCAELGKAIGEEAIVVNEAITNVPALNYMPRTRPGTYFSNGGGGLGFAGGVALGIKLARPEALVVAICGDASFGFSAPGAVHAAAAKYRLPILSVILDNRGWGAVKRATLAQHPKGEAANAHAFFADYGADMRWEKAAEGAGAHVERVADPARLTEAYGRALAAVASGQAAVVVAEIEPV